MCIFVLDRDKSRQAVDELIMQEPRHLSGKKNRKGSLELHDRIEAGNRLHRSRRLAAAISAISSKPTPNTSWRRKAARSSGDRRSSAIIRGSSQGPIYVSRPCRADFKWPGQRRVTTRRRNAVSDM